MDALLRLSELIKENPNASVEELGAILVEEGYAKNEQCLQNFLDSVST